MTIDIKNIFNSPPWNGIVKEFKCLRVEGDLKTPCSISLELPRRKQLIEWERTMLMSCGIPQGSILGPLLWNTYYDGVFGTQLSNRVEGVGFANEIAVMASIKTGHELEQKLNIRCSEISEWLESRSLQLTPRKTESLESLTCAWNVSLRKKWLRVLKTGIRKNSKTIFDLTSSVLCICETNY